jgi:hypothetical protein
MGTLKALDPADNWVAVHACLRLAYGGVPRVND